MNVRPDSMDPFIPLESDPVIMTDLLRKIGLSTDVEFHDVYGFDDELLTFIPRPVVGVLLLYHPNSIGRAEAGDINDANVIWIKQ